MAKVIGATNKYYLSTKQSTPVRTVQMVAERGWLSKSWDLYTISDRPWMPRARWNSHPNKQKVASDLSLTEVFARMQAHEEREGDPAQGKKQERHIRNENTCDDYDPNIIPHDEAAESVRRLMGKDPSNVFKQDIPSDMPNYWRNIQKKLGL